MPDSAVSVSPKPPVDALPFDLDHVTEDLRIRARTELLEDENRIEQSLKLLRSKLKDEPNLRWQDEDLFLLAFLRAKKFDVDRAFSLIKSFYTCIGERGDVFYNMDFECLRSWMEENLLYFLPYRDREGSVIFMYRCGEWTMENSTAEDHLVCLFLGILQALKNPSTQIAGFHLIVDFKDYSVKHLVHSTPSVVKLFFADMMQNVLPVRTRGFHLVNQNHLFPYIWPLVKVFVSKKFRGRNVLPARTRGFHLGNQNDLFSYIWPFVKVFFPKKLRDRNVPPVRMRGFHFLNQNPLFPYIWPLVKVFLIKKLRDRNVPPARMQGFHFLNQNPLFPYIWPLVKVFLIKKLRDRNVLPARMRSFHLVYQNNLFPYIWPLVKVFLSKKLRDRNVLPARMRGFHLVNQNHLFSYIWPFVKIFLSKKLRDRIHFHGSDMKSLHKFFHPSILPADLEGEMPPFDNTPWREKMEASTDYLKHALSFGYEYYLRKD